MRCELFFRGKRIAALEARLDVLERDRGALFEALRRMVEAADPAAAKRFTEGYEQPSRPALRVVK